MSRTHRERVLDYLWSISPDYATNSQIQRATGIKSHQQVYLLTQELMHSHWIRGERRGREWVFWADESPTVHLASPGRASRKDVAAESGERLSPPAFEELARTVMSRHFGVPLGAAEAPGVPKEFDMVSPKRDIVGDAKYFTLVRGQRLPPAKFSVIAEHVWLLEKCAATTSFLVFGNDRRVPELWLKRYGHLVSEITFYFLTDEGELERLTLDNAARSESSKGVLDGRMGSILGLKMMPIFELPNGLNPIAHFIVPRVQTWGSQRDTGFKEEVRQAVDIAPETATGHEWFVFSIRCVLGESRGRQKRQVPDVENIPKLIVDAFTGLLYPDDNLHHVRGVQVEAEWGPDEHEHTEVWIFGKPTKE